MATLLTQAEANYRRGDQQASCGICRNFRPDGSCAVVEPKGAGLDGLTAQPILPGIGQPRGPIV